MRAQDNKRCLDKETSTPLGLLSYEKLLAESLKGFLAELCFTNAGIIMAYISANQDGNLEDILASSAELCLKPGLISYGHKATFESDWGLPPYVSIDLIFRHGGVHAHFKVIFDDNAIGVDIERILFSETLGDPQENLTRFAKALADARLATQ